MANYTIKENNGTMNLYKDGELTDAKLTIRNGADKQEYYFLPKGYEEIQGQAKVVLVNKAIAETGEYVLKERVRLNRECGTKGKKSDFNPADWLDGEDKAKYEELVKKAEETSKLREDFKDCSPAELREIQKLIEKMRTQKITAKK